MDEKDTELSVFLILSQKHRIKKLIETNTTVSFTADHTICLFFLVGTVLFMGI